MNVGLFMDSYGQLILMVLASLWVLPWKGIALWKAARHRHKIWFVVLLVINTLALLEILYIFVFSKRQGKIKINDRQRAESESRT